MDWLPIETAPKDGSRMLLAAIVNGQQVVAVGGYDPHWAGRCWCYDSPRIPTGLEPTHWMPLPAPPSEATK